MIPPRTSGRNVQCFVPLNFTVQLDAKFSTYLSNIDVQRQSFVTCFDCWKSGRITDLLPLLPLLLPSPALEKQELPLFTLLPFEPCLRGRTSSGWIGPSAFLVFGETNFDALLCPLRKTSQGEAGAQ
jgi:hypothetical protein